MTVSLHEIEAWVGTQKIGVKEASITMDETWSPYVQGSLTTVLDMDLLDALDPRTGARLKVFATQEYGVSDKLSALTAAHTGFTMAHVTTAWTSKTIGELSAWYFAPFNQEGSNKLDTLSSIFSGGTIAGMTTAWAGLLFSAISEKYYRSYPDGINNNHRRGFDLTVRSRELNLNEGTMTFQLASDEALLQDYALVQTINYSPASLDLRTIVKEVLANIGDALVDGTDTATVSSTAAIWTPGQTAWDYLQPLLKNVGLRLYCDEQRMWHLISDTSILDGLVELFSVGTIKTTSEVIDRNAGEWFDAVVIKYTYVNDLGATVTAYDTAAVENYQKVKLIEYQSAYPGPGAAQRILDRATARGRQQDVTAVSNYAVTPTTACTIYITGYPTLNNYIQAVTWNFPSDEMTIKTRQPVNN